MYRIVVTNRTERPLSLCETTSIAPGMGRVVAATPDIVVADRMVAVAGLGAIMDFAPAERTQFIVTTTEFGCELDHPEHGRISVTIFDPCALELGLPEAAADGAAAFCNN